jgi:hypothetical protein
VSLSPQARHGAESLSEQAKRGVTPIARLPKREKRHSRLSRRTELNRGSTSLKRTPLGHCTNEQKARVKDHVCVSCGNGLGHCHPAHLIDSGGLSEEVANDVRAVVPLCSVCHRLYDDGQLDLSPYLEPLWRDAVVWAVEAVGLFRALRRITGQRWAPIEREAYVHQPEGVLP